MSPNNLPATQARSNTQQGKNRVDNFCRIHRSPRAAPAMKASLTAHLCTFFLKLPRERFPDGD